MYIQIVYFTQQFNKINTTRLGDRFKSGIHNVC